MVMLNEYENPPGIQYIQIGYEFFEATEVVWFLNTGEWAEHGVYQIDEDMMNLEFSNLKERESSNKLELNRDFLFMLLLELPEGDLFNILQSYLVKQQESWPDYRGDRRFDVTPSVEEFADAMEKFIEG